MSVNAEHYKDPTASQAVYEVSKEQPIQYLSTPAYVRPKNPPRFRHSSVKVEEMSMDELMPYIHNCAKSKMTPRTCMNCNPGCVFGRRAKELMDQESSPVKNDMRGVVRRVKAMQEYQAAIASGDVMRYALEHAKSSDPKKAKAAAYARVAFWRKNYGGLIKEVPKPKQDPVPEKNTDAARMFAEKLASLRKEGKKVHKQIEDLKLEEDSINKQINTILETASMLGIVIT